MLNGTNMEGRTVGASERRVLTINQLADAQTVRPYVLGFATPSNTAGKLIPQVLFKNMCF